MTKKETAKTPAKSYVRNDAEVKAIEAVRKKAKNRTRAPDFKLYYDETNRSVAIDFDHPDGETAAYLAMTDMGTADPRFYYGLIGQIAKLGAHGVAISEDASNFALGVIAAVEPQDEVEAMLAAQMAAVHQATMMMARRLNHVKNLPQQDSAERALNKLARTFATQMETLKRYRSKGQQVVRVERVTVADGGQAIVGNVESGRGRADNENRR